MWKMSLVPGSMPESPLMISRPYPCNLQPCAAMRASAVERLSSRSRRLVREQSSVQREELLAAARRRDIDLVIVWRLDRWGRSLVDLVNTLQELVALKVGFVSLSEALDLTTPSGKALAGMLAVFAEFERDIRKRLMNRCFKFGLEQA